MSSGYVTISPGRLVLAVIIIGMALVAAASYRSSHPTENRFGRDVTAAVLGEAGDGSSLVITRMDMPAATAEGIVWTRGGATFRRYSYDHGTTTMGREEAWNGRGIGAVTGLPPAS